MTTSEKTQPRLKARHVHEVGPDGDDHGPSLHDGAAPPASSVAGRGAVRRGPRDDGDVTTVTTTMTMTTSTAMTTPDTHTKALKPKREKPR